MNQGSLWPFQPSRELEILCSFRLVLEGKTDKEIPKSSRLEFLKKFLENNFALSDVEDNTLGPVNRGSIWDLPLLVALLVIRPKSREPSFWEEMDWFVLLTYTSLTTWRTLLQRSPACLIFTLDSEDSFCWYKKKNEFYNFLQHKQLRRVRLDLIITMRDIYISSNMNPLLKFTNSTRIISTRIVISYGMKQDILFYVWWKVNGDWDKYMIRFSQWMESNYRTNISFRKNKSKGTRLCKSQSGIQVGKLAIWVRSFEIHKLFTEAPSLPEVRLTLLNTNPVFQCFEPSVSVPQGKKIISWKFIFKFCEVFHNICSFDFHLQSKFIVIINIILSSCNIIFLVVINNHLSRIY